MIIGLYFRTICKSDLAKSVLTSHLKLGSHQISGRVLIVPPQPIVTSL